MTGKRLLYPTRRLQPPQLRMVATRGPPSPTRYPGAQPKKRCRSAVLPLPPIAAHESDRATINLILAQMVVLHPVEAEDLEWQLQISLAGVLILLVDAIKTDDSAALLQHKEKRQQVVRNLLETSSVWGGHAFEGSVGAFLYKKNRVAECRLLGVHGVGDHKDMSADFFLKQGYMKPATAIAVGVCYRVNQNLKRDAPWPRDFITLVVHRAREDSVRFL